MNQLIQLVLFQDVVVVLRLKQRLLHHNRLIIKILLSEENLVDGLQLVGIEEEQQQQNYQMWVSDLLFFYKKCFSLQGNRYRLLIIVKIIQVVTF